LAVDVWLPSLRRVALPATALLLGLVASAAGWPELGRWIWMAGIVGVLAALVVSIARGLARREFGLDAIAALAMLASLALREELAGMVVGLMYAGGQALEAFARGRAAREMTALLARAPRTALIRRGETIESVALEAVRPGDRLLIRPGDIVPTDGLVREGGADLDESALTGEAMPVHHEAGSVVMSGATNCGNAFDLDVTARADASTYAGIISLVESARRSKAPISRLADRYALLFLVLTIGLTVLAWLLSHDPRRALAVLVVATPCPLILAVPVAMVAGMSRAARAGLLVKSAEALEHAAHIGVLLVDKTGTLTHGRPRLLAVEPFGRRRPDDLLRTAASLAQASSHVANVAVVQAARERGLDLASPRNVVETAGAGLSGEVGNECVVMGRPDFVLARTKASRRERPDGTSWVRSGTAQMAVAINDTLEGVVVVADVVRSDAASTLQTLRRLGVGRIVLVTGDHAEIAASVAQGLGLDSWVADTTPAEKVAIVAREAQRGKTMMIGDGINDAAALARADVGVALGASGTAAAWEAADVVILVDRLERVADLVAIAGRTRAIALQSVFAGIALSALGMVVAALGYLPPIGGALAQEVIDVAVVLNALRALGSAPAPRSTGDVGSARNPKPEQATGLDRGGSPRRDPVLASSADSRRNDPP
jgi:heavy metal translocating P-type ATPase